MKGPRIVAHLLCDFCGKDEAFVETLIAGPQGHHICDECIATCVEIIADSKARRAEAAKSKVAAPESAPAE